MKKVKIFKRSVPAIAVLLISVCTVLAMGVGTGILVYKNMIANHNAGKAPTQSNPVSAAYPDSGGSGNALPGDNASSSTESTMARLESQMATVTDKVSSSVSFPSGEKGTKGNWMLGNPAGNRVFMQATLVNGSGQTIATSVVLKPGQHIESLTLSRDVPAGSSTVTAYISYYALDTQAYIGKSAYQIRLSVI